MSTIQNMIRYNKNFKNKRLDTIETFINNLTDYTENDQKIIHNTILNILNKKNIQSEEINILNSIITKLSEDPNTLNTRKTSTIIFLINEIYNDIFQRDNDLETLKKSLHNIPNNIIKLLLDTFEKAKNSFTINTSKLNKEKYYESLEDKARAHIIGYYRINDNEPIMVLFYGREEKNGSKFKSFLDPVPLKDISEYYTELSTTNKTDKEKFSLIKSVSGKSPKIERDGNKYKYNIGLGENNPIIYTELEGKGKNDLKLIKPLGPLITNNISKNSKNRSKNNSEIKSGNNSKKSQNNNSANISSE